jgi:hypothetical protein
MASVHTLSDNLGLVTNPYGSRVPVTDPTRFYGRHSDILRVAVNIRNWEPFAVSGEPRIGKTSLLYYLIHPDGARKLPEFLAYIGNPTDYLFVLVELQLLPVRNAQGFWRYLFDRLVEESREAEIEIKALQAEYRASQKSGSDHYQTQTSFERYLKQLERRVVLLFDDFDIVINDFDSSEVLQVTDKLRTLKALGLNSKLNYVIASTDPLVRLFKAKGITSPSPLSSIIIPAPPLGLLEKDAADELLQKPLQQSTWVIQQFTEEDIVFIRRLAGRHPDFMKISCFYLLAAKSQGHIDYSDVWQTIENDAHIQWLMKGLWERVKQGEQLDELPLREVLLQIAQGQVPTNSRAFKELRQRGLVDDSTSSPQLFGELFRAFVQHPDTRPAMPTELTPLESKLYNYLSEHAEQTCTREQLQKVIWEDKPPASPDALEQLVRRVRGKIEPNPDQPIYLLNVRGQGYFLRQVPTR